MGVSKISIVLLPLVLAFFSDISRSRAASFQGLGYLTGGSCSEATAVSADGSVVVGTSCTASGVRAFRWTATDGLTPIPIPDGLAECWATDVSADGNFVAGYGRASDSPPFGHEGFRWYVSGAMNHITAPGIDITAVGVSGDGSIVVGTSWATAIDEEAFRWTVAGGLGRLDGLHNGEVRSSVEAISADGLVVVGHRIYDGSPYRDCFHWAEGNTVGFDAHTANATSSDGSVVVGGLDNHHTQLFEAYRWTRGTGLCLLGTCLPNFHSRALGVSGDGSIVVGYVQNNSGFDEQKAFIWDEQHGMRLLQDVLEDDFGLDLSGWQLAEPWASWKATAISDDGLTIVGVALNSQGQREAWRAVLCKPGIYVVDDNAPNDPGPDDPCVSDPLENGTLAHPFDVVQEAIDAACNGDTVIVLEGTYREFVNFKGKNIVVTGTKPNNSAIVKSTTIVGGVCFRGTEDASCKLTGFNIDGCIFGFDQLIDPVGKNHTHAAISHCVLENVVTGCGRVIYACDGTISNCLIANISYMCLAPWPVPAIVGCHGLIKNCTMLNIHDGVRIFEGETCTIENCIIYRASPIFVPDGATVNISYTDVQYGRAAIFGTGTVNWGPGNIDADPCVARLGNWQVTGDYHLKSQAGRYEPNSETWFQDDVTSPCIDAGNPMSPIGTEPFPNGGRINMGSYGGTAEASKSYFGEPVCEIIVAGDINGDCEVNFKDFAIMARQWLRDENP